MITITVPVWLVAVAGVLAVTGFCAVFVAVADLAGRAVAWGQARWYRRRRGQPQGVSDDCWFGAHEDCDGCECAGCGHGGLADPLLGLPPERTWEQMTSHQLPLLTPQEKFPASGWSSGYLPQDWHAQARERRMPGWEAESRQAYAALDLEYPSGLLARVREAAQ